MVTQANILGFDPYWDDEPQGDGTPLTTMVRVTFKDGTGGTQVMDPEGEPLATRDDSDHDRPADDVETWGAILSTLPLARFHALQAAEL